MCKKCERFGIAGIVDTRTVPNVKYLNLFFVLGVDFFGEKKSVAVKQHWKCAYLCLLTQVKNGEEGKKKMGK